jgi:hypothetical protein
MIVIKTMIGIITMIGIAYALYVIGKLTQRYVFREREPDPVLIMLAGIIGIAGVGAVVSVFVSVFVLAYVIGSAMFSVI